MSYQDHLKTCDYCQKGLPIQTHNKPTIFIKSASSYSKQKPTIHVESASSYNRRKKMGELGAIIRGTSYPSLEPIPIFRTKGGSSFN